MSIKFFDQWNEANVTGTSLVFLFFQNPAHPNVKLFIYQGGLQSTEEAIENGIPVIGFPIFSDQVSNLNRLKSFGMAQSLDITSLDRTVLKETIFESINNKR